MIIIKLLTNVSFIVWWKETTNKYLLHRVVDLWFGLGPMGLLSWA